MAKNDDITGMSWWDHLGADLFGKSGGIGGTPNKMPDYMAIRERAKRMSKEEFAALKAGDKNSIINAINMQGVGWGSDEVNIMRRRLGLEPL